MNNKNTASTARGQKHKVFVNLNNLYTQALFNVLNQFVLEEAMGNLFTEERLIQKIKMAKGLYDAERRVLNKANRYVGRIDVENAEIMFLNN